MTSRARRFRVAVRKLGPLESAIVKQWDSFEALARTGLELDPVALDLHPLSEALFESGGLARGDWDVAFINTDWIASAYRQGVLADLAGLISADPPEGYPAGWAASMLRLQEIEKQVLGIPYHDGPECLIYRTDLLENPAERAAYEAKFDTPLRVPETWEEFRRIARHFHHPEKGQYGTIYAAYPDGHNTVYDFSLQLWTRGGELMDPKGNLRLNTPEAGAALQFLREMVNDRSAVHPQCRELDSVKSGLAFANGEAALMVNWFGFASMAQTLSESKVKDRVGVAEIPHAEGFRGTSLNIYWILSIASGSPHRQIAWRFLRHCASPEMDKLLTLEGAIGCRKSTWADEQVNHAIPFYRQMETLHANAREMPRIAVWPKVAEVIDRMVLEAIDTGEAVEQITMRAQTALSKLPEIYGSSVERD